jgi:transcriptional regulator with XRE-family HTH domain
MLSTAMSRNLNPTRYEHLAVNLRRERRLADLTQTELAKRAGPEFCRAYVSTLERGLWPTVDRHVARLEAVLRLPRGTLLRRPVTHRGTTNDRSSKKSRSKRPSVETSAAVDRRDRSAAAAGGENTAITEAQL